MLIKQLLKQKWYIIIILASIIIEPSINSILNFWLKRLFDTAQPGVQRIDILRLLVGGFLLWILKRVINFLSGVVKNRYICNVKQEVKHRLFMNLIGMKTSNISRIASSGEYISLFTNDITILENRFFNQVVGFVSAISSVIILGGSFVALNAKLALSILCFGVASLFVPLILSQKLNEKNLKYSQKISQFTQRMKEYMTAYPTIKNYSIEREISDKFNNANQEVEESKFDADYTLTLANNIGSLLSWFMQFIAIGIGLILVTKGEFLVGTVIAARSFASDLAYPLQDIIGSLNSMRSVKAVINKIEKLVTDGEKSSLEDADRKAIVLPKTNGDICFSHFGLTIEGNPIIEDVSFRFEAGKKYLIIGMNGAGKSSIFKTLKNWYPEFNGEISILGTNVRNIPIEQLNNMVSYLGENVSLFCGTIAENIALFKNINENEIRNAAKTAGIQIDLNRMIKDGGTNISSGEQRKIEIARSLLNSSQYLIFDEVISTLDIESAYEIEKMVLGYADKTIIFISHNFSGKLIRMYDEILVMDKGQLIDHGNYETLLKKSDYFRKICTIKFGISESQAIGE